MLYSNVALWCYDEASRIRYGHLMGTVGIVNIVLVLSRFPFENIYEVVYMCGTYIYRTTTTKTDFKINYLITTKAIYVTVTTTANSRRYGNAILLSTFLCIFLTRGATHHITYATT